MSTVRKYVFANLFFYTKAKVVVQLTTKFKIFFPINSHFGQNAKNWGKNLI